MACTCRQSNQLDLNRQRFALGYFLKILFYDVLQTSYVPSTIIVFFGRKCRACTRVNKFEQITVIVLELMPHNVVAVYVCND